MSRGTRLTGHASGFTCCIRCPSASTRRPRIIQALNTEEISYTTRLPLLKSQVCVSVCEVQMTGPNTLTSDCQLRPEEKVSLRVLLSAYACEPGRGSEPAVGWNWVPHIAKRHDVWVITRANNRSPIEKALGKPAPENVHWIYFDLPPWARFWKKRERGLHLYYWLWQL